MNHDMHMCYDSIMASILININEYAMDPYSHAQLAVMMMMLMIM